MVFDEMLEGQKELTKTMEEIHTTLRFSNRIIMMVNVVNIATIIVVGLVLLKWNSQERFGRVQTSKPTLSPAKEN